ncbi:TlpA family protein disulfide reductase [Chitinophaga nivalis]|uniref:TlpA family protein disulfide reductase n=1 Tax=Chitinophaga nivalis TaxID=2991709 RepID=A0ABT3IHB3_9BACT|nr:TlpA disulfide reductase family protein [Chitinophaga nivalis]MCW3466960.1 TlpA family protein disulfide reductase [Chitinophaga nivalis]MCW3483349.1 TlpA family protein disulfide reductase [Chitinophaga nivalis]
MIKLLLLGLVFNSNSDNPGLEKTKQKYRNAKLISYTQTAYYPLPDVDLVDSNTVSYTIFNPANYDFEYFARRGSIDEAYQKKIFTEVRHNEKTYYRYEDTVNQSGYLKSSLLKKYGPVSLLTHEWTYVNDTLMAGVSYADYSRIESSWEYEGKKIVVKHHIYISPDYSIARFERKNYVEGKLTQIVIYKFYNYVFEAKASKTAFTTPEKYSLKYFERIKKLKPLEPGVKVPPFKGIDIRNSEIELSKFIGKKTLLLFSATNCGYSQLVTDHINQSDFILEGNIRLINFFGSDLKERVTKYLKRYKVNYPVITDRKDIETEYGISGYPILYMLDENGILSKSLSGSSDIIGFLDSQRKK